MSERWVTFPAAMGDDQAWLTCCVTYAEDAATDTRNSVLRVQLSFHNPTESGMPTSDEYPALKRLDQALEQGLDGQHTAYVGRVTVAAKRFFYFYTRLNEDEARARVSQVAGGSGYLLTTLYEPDPKKERYWRELYPTDDDWQVIRDISVIDQLNENGDDNEVPRDVQHWAYFNTANDVGEFMQWLDQHGYRSIQRCPPSDDNRLGVTFVHTGTMRLADITQHTIRCARRARELGGDYDGWETSVEVPH